MILYTFNQSLVKGIFDKKLRGAYTTRRMKTIATYKPSRKREAGRPSLLGSFSPKTKFRCPVSGQEKTLEGWYRAGQKAAGDLMEGLKKAEKAGW